MLSRQGDSVSDRAREKRRADEAVQLNEPRADAENRVDAPVRHQLLVRLPVLLIPARVCAELGQPLLVTPAAPEEGPSAPQSSTRRRGRSDALERARLVVTSLAVEEEDAEVDDVEVRQRALEPAGEAPRPRHDPVAHAAREGEGRTSEERVSDAHRDLRSTSEEEEGRGRRTSSGAATGPTSPT